MALPPLVKRLHRVPVLGQYTLLIAGLVAWQLVAARYQTYVLPSPTRIAAALWAGVSTGEVFPHIWISVQRVVLGWGLASAVGIALGFLMAFSLLARKQLLYLVRMIQPIPGIAWIGVTLIWFGVGEASIVGVIMLTVLPIVSAATYEGFRNVDADYLRAARTLGARTGWDLFRYVTLPAALPQVLAGLNIGLAQAWRVLAAAELVGSLSGLGYWMQLNQVALRTENVFVVLVIFAILMYIFEQGIYRPLQRKVLGRWAKV